jgi:biotin carboxyl carrier protein
MANKSFFCEALYNLKRRKNVSAKTGKQIEVKAPMSGVFYQRPSPDEPPYVKEGDTVKKKQVLALLETMKVFQKVKSPANGRITKIAVEDETPVKDETLLFIIEA